MVKQTNRQDFATKLTTARKAARLTSYQLARRAGLDADVVIRLQRGRQDPPLEAVRKLTSTLKASKGSSS